MGRKQRNGKRMDLETAKQILKELTDDSNTCWATREACDVIVKHLDSEEE